MRQAFARTFGAGRPNGAEAEAEERRAEAEKKAKRPKAKNVHAQSDYGGGAASSLSVKGEHERRCEAFRAREAAALQETAVLRAQLGS